VADQERQVKNVSGKVAVITGGAAGIGLGIVEACVEAGMRVAVVDFRKDVLEGVVERLRSSGADIAGFQADVSRLDDVKRVADDVVRTFGGVYYLHNNAGVALFEPMAETTMEEFKWVMDVNFWGVLYGIQVFRPVIEREPEGYISTSSSMVGLLGLQGHAAYSSSKHAVIGLMTTLERELRAIDSPIRASVLCPTSVASDIIDASRVHRAAAIGLSDENPQTSRDSRDPGDIDTFVSGVDASDSKQQAGRALLALIEGVESRSAIDVGREVLEQVLEPRFWLFTESSWIQHVREQVEASIRDGSLSQLA
jgi:NAD(P)-dependent dehydrogenase (short-subunit alcohol dehydrogenase family)